MNVQNLFDVGYNLITMQPETVDMSKVHSMGILARPLYKRDGDFKKWQTVGWVQVQKDVPNADQAYDHLKIHDRHARELAKVMKMNGYKLVVSKTTHECFKRSANAMRKVTEWSWRVDK